MPLVYVAERGDDAYIGATGGTLGQRQNSHRKDALRKQIRHPFENLLREHGIAGFIWTVLWEGSDIMECRRKEAHFIKLLNPTLNVRSGRAPGNIRHNKHRPLLLPFESIDGEEWRSVAGFEGRYEISSLGRVKTLERTVKNPIVGMAIRPSGIMRTPAPRGRPRVTLCRDGIEYNKKVQDLVAETFIGPRPAGMFVLHRDDDKGHNTPGNLYYGTSQDNADDRERNGRTARGEKSARAVISEDQAKTVLLLSSEGKRQSEIVRVTGISKQIVSNIRRGRSWKHLSGSRPEKNNPRRRVRCIEDGLEFESIRAAAKHYGISKTHLQAVVNGVGYNRSAHGLHFEIVR